MDLERPYDCVPRGILWAVVREYRANIQSLYCWSLSLVCIVSRVFTRLFTRKETIFSAVLFIIFWDRIYKSSKVVEGVRFSSLRIPFLLFVDVFTKQWSPAHAGTVCSWEWGVRMRIRIFKSEAIVFGQKRVDCPLGLRGGFKILGSFSQAWEKWSHIWLKSQDGLNKKEERRLINLL